jgi:hypothetical protein
MTTFLNLESWSFPSSQFEIREQPHQPCEGQRAAIDFVCELLSENKVIAISLRFAQSYFLPISLFSIRADLEWIHLRSAPSPNSLGLYVTQNLELLQESSSLPDIRRI